MKCANAQKFLDDFLLGELDPETEMQINEHLNECNVCREALRTREDFMKEFKIGTAHEPAQTIYPQIKKRIVRSVYHRRYWWIFPRQFVYTLGAFILGIVIMRIADVISQKKPESLQVEIYRVPVYQEPFADTVQFYTAPAKHLARS
jgi:predicted anti-sigma-YlaC factor YlaD